MDMEWNGRCSFFYDATFFFDAERGDLGARHTVKFLYQTLFKLRNQMEMHMGDGSSSQRHPQQQLR
jgi:hypothetical protein